MGKRNKRPGRPAPDIHARIKAHADALKAMAQSGATDAAKLPEVGDLMDATTRAIEDAIPCAVEHEGRRYFVRVRRMVLHLEIFDAPGSAEPLLCGMVASLKGGGHVPAH